MDDSKKEKEKEKEKEESNEKKSDKKTELWDKVKLDEEDIPDWLKWSLEESKKEKKSEDNIKNVSVPKEKKLSWWADTKVSKKKKEETKEKKSDKTDKKDELWDDWMTIPDWLKTD